MKYLLIFLIVSIVSCQSKSDILFEEASKAFDNSHRCFEIAMGIKDKVNNKDIFFKYGDSVLYYGHIADSLTQAWIQLEK